MLSASDLVAKARGQVENLAPAGVAAELDFIADRKGRCCAGSNSGTLA